MCGIVGFVDIAHNLDSKPSFLINQMANELHSRGPDSNGNWVDLSSGVFLGHSRLAIIDTSKHGNQPMLSQSGRFVLSYNGEIYNHNDLKRKLDKNFENISWRGNSDTEILLMFIEKYGIKKALRECEGMFAFALFDKVKKNLTLARDRIGEKPIYFGVNNQVLFFASQLKALKRHSKFQPEIDRNSIALQFKYNYIPTPYSIYKGIKKLNPGSYLTIPISKSYKGTEDLPSAKKYWELKNFTEEKYRYSKPYTDAKNELVEILSHSIEDQLISDMPIGVFLSGGIDSSTITAIAQSISSKKIDTFSIGFQNKYFNEANYAKKVAQYLGTNHRELYVDSNDALSAVSKIPYIYDEPFSDSSQIPTYLLSSLTKNHVSVALSGDGGDELFSGYNRHIRSKSLFKKIMYLPVSMRKLFLILSKLIPINLLEKILFSFLKTPHFSEKISKLIKLLNSKSYDEMYLMLVSHWLDEENPVIGFDKEIIAQSIFSEFNFEEFENIMVSNDIENYLSDDILVKVDRASMACSLETRAPFLNHKVVEFAMSLPQDMKTYQNKGKIILRDVLNNYLPVNLIDRPKMGFSIPLSDWLKGPLISWAEDLLNEEKINTDGYLNSKTISHKWNEHKSGRKDWHHDLWDVLMFQQWLNHETKLN